jgi:hypothetical protein
MLENERLARIENGQIQELYWDTDAALNNIKQGFPDAEWHVVPEFVERGSTWPLVSSPASASVREDAVEPPQLNRAQVLNQMDQLIEQHKVDYLSKWPTSSTQNLWLAFDAELSELWGLGATTSIAWPKFPALRAAVALDQGTTPDLITSEQVRVFAELISNKKASHIQRLLALETLYRKAVAAYDAADGRLDALSLLKADLEAL